MIYMGQQGAGHEVKEGIFISDHSNYSRKLVVGYSISYHGKQLIRGFLHQKAIFYTLCFFFYEFWNYFFLRIFIKFRKSFENILSL